MKKIILTLSMAVCLLSAAAQNPYTYLKIDNDQLIYEKVFNIDSCNAAQIETKLIAYLPTAKGVTNVKTTNGLITANFVNLLIDYKKYGGSTGGIAIFAASPLNANITIQIKDGRYKVTVSSIVFLVNMLGTFGAQVVTTNAESVFLKGQIKEYRTRENIVESGGYMEQQFTDIFTLKAVNQDW